MMDEKGKNVIVIIVSLIIAIIFGYVVMYIKTPTVKEEPENNTTIVDFNIENLNFSNYLYDVDGNSENETSAIIKDSVVYLTINENEYALNNFGNPICVRVEHAIKDKEFNVIYVLSTNKLYYITDIEYESALEAKLKPVFNEVEINDPIAIAIISEYDSKTEYRYPTIYVKTKDDKMYVSRFGSEFSEYEK